jgi:phosphatidylserine/phosphatidylglycerophosphate/cardiolipin synthase-like enzyme
MTRNSPPASGSSQTSQQKKLTPLQKIVYTIIGAVVIAVSAYLGIDLSDVLDDSEPTAVVVPTSAPTLQLITPSPESDGTPVAVVPADVSRISLGQGYGAQARFWTVYFTAPTGSRDFDTYFGGVDEEVIAAINAVQSTLDIAVFEWNNPRITQAVLDAHNRGVRVRMVVDDEHTLLDDRSTINTLIDAGVPVVDDSRTGFMHNKFMIMDGGTVITGSMNFTMNGTYRNNNNVLVLRSRRVAEVYLAKFEEMFVDRVFSRSLSDNHGTALTLDGIPIEILFSPEDDVVGTLLDLINSAQTHIRVMAFSFTLDELGEALLRRSEEGVEVKAIFELRGSRTQFSVLPMLYCAGLIARQDGNPFTFHHKVFIIDDYTVATGSFNFSANATRNNDENMIIIHDPALAALYIEEFYRVNTEAVPPPEGAIECN